MDKEKFWFRFGIFEFSEKIWKQFISQNQEPERHKPVTSKYAPEYQDLVHLSQAKMPTKLLSLQFQSFFFVGKRKICLSNAKT